MIAVRIAAGALVSACLALSPLVAGATSAQFAGGPLPPSPALIRQVAPGPARNQDGEPGMAADGSGTFWIGSDIAPYARDDPRTAQALSGEDIWKSTDGGLSYQWVADPFAAGGSSSAGPGGEDSDLAAATDPNPQGRYNVYAVSLWIGSTSAAVSEDGGATWSLNPLGGIPAEDRPWVAADGSCVFYVAYHQLPTFSPVVNRYDTCDQTDLALGEALNPVQSTQVFLANTAPGFSNAFGKLRADNSPTSPHRHNLYIPMMGCDLQQAQDFANNVVLTAEQVPVCPTPYQVTIAVSTDGDKTWSDYQVAVGGPHQNEIPVWPDQVTTDAAGNVYLAWSDNHDVFLASSQDGGQTWSAPVQVNQGPSLAGVYPVLAGGGPGQVEVAWYGADRAGDANDPGVMGYPNGSCTAGPPLMAGPSPCPSPSPAHWYVYWARSLDGGRTFNQVQASAGAIHTGELCTKGSACSDANSRNLLDDFDIAVSPTTGLASIAYTDDQPEGQQDTAYTAFATEVPGPAATVPEAPAALALLAAGGGAGLLVTAVGARRRRPRGGAPAQVS